MQKDMFLDFQEKLSAEGYLEINFSHYSLNNYDYAKQEMNIMIT